MFCKECGAKIGDGAATCGACGVAVDRSSAEPVSAAGSTAGDAPPPPSGTEDGLPYDASVIRPVPSPDDRGRSRIPLILIGIVVAALAVTGALLVLAAGGDQEDAGATDITTQADQRDDEPLASADDAGTSSTEPGADREGGENDEATPSARVVAAEATTPETTPPTTTPPAATTVAPTTASPTAPPPTAPPATAAPAPPATAAPAPPATAAPAAPPAPAAAPFEPYQLATSSAGDPIFAYRGGTLGGTPVVFVGGVYPEGRRGESVANALIGMSPPQGIEMYVVPNPNPSGRGRLNPRGVNLNRNFPTGDWSFIAPGDNHSGGAGGSEIETQNLVSLFDQLQPVLVINASDTNDGAVDYNPLVERGDLPDSLARRLGLSVTRVPCDSCTGNLTTYVNERYGDAFFLGVPAGFDAGAYAAAINQLTAEI